MLLHPKYKLFGVVRFVCGFAGPFNLSPTGVVSDATRVRTNAVDFQEMLTKSGVFVDGAPRTSFSYNANSGALFFTGRNLREGKHAVRVAATDA